MPDLLSTAAPDPLPVYLAVMSLVTLAVAALDGWRRGRRGPDAGVSHAALSLLSFAGGAAGGVLGFLLFDRRSNKRNVTWHVFSLVALMAWALVLVALYVGPLDVGALRAALARDHTVLLAYLGGASAVTFVAFVADKLVAMHNGRGHDASRLPEMLLLLLALAGGAPGGLLAMLLVRHKIRKPAFAAGLPMMLAVQAAAVAYLIQFGLA